MKKFLICLMAGLFLVTSLGMGCKKKEEATAPKTEVTEEAPAPAEHKAPEETKETQEQKTPAEHPQESQPEHH